MKTILTLFFNSFLILSVCFSASGNPMDVPYSFLKKQPLSGSTIDCSNNSSNKIPTGAKVAYKTNAGRFGVFEVVSYGLNLTLSWVTYNADETVYSSGTSMVVNASYYADFDQGTKPVSASDADFWWELKTLDSRFIVPQNAATFFVLPDQSCLSSLTTIGSYSIQTIKSFSVTSDEINGSNNTQNKIPAGTKVVYKTNEGRYGVLEIVSISNTNDMSIKWITYDATGVIYSEGCNLLIPGSYVPDLDSGKLTTSTKAGDFWWHIKTSTIRVLEPQNGALFYVSPPSNLCINNLTPLELYTNSVLKNLTYGSDKINGSNNSSNKIPSGTKIAFKTTEGRYGILEIVTIGFDLTIKWVTYDSTGLIHSEGCNLLIPGTYSADLDSGKVTNSDTAADFWWDEVTRTVRYFYPQNTAMFLPSPPDPACINSLISIKNYAYSTIKSTPLSSNSINGSSNSQSQLPAGAKVMYKTNEGRFGIMEILNAGQDLTFKWITYASTGSVFSEGCDRIINGSYHADLDSGIQTSSDINTDFWWNTQTSVVRFLKPENQAMFFVVGSSVLGLTSDIQSEKDLVIFPNPSSEFIAHPDFSEAVQVKIVSSDGLHMIELFSPNQDRINIQLLKPGIYSVQIVSENKTGYYRMVKK